MKDADRELHHRLRAVSVGLTETVLAIPASSPEHPSMTLYPIDRTWAHKASERPGYRDAQGPRRSGFEDHRKIRRCDI